MKRDAQHGLRRFLGHFFGFGLVGVAWVGLYYAGVPYPGRWFRIVALALTFYIVFHETRSQFFRHSQTKGKMVLDLISKLAGTWLGTLGGWHWWEG